MCYRADYCLYSKVNRNETTDIVNPVFRRTPLEHVVSTERYVVRRGKEKRRDGRRGRRRKRRGRRRRRRNGIREQASFDFCSLGLLLYGVSALWDTVPRYIMVKLLPVEASIGAQLLVPREIIEIMGPG